jgi:hypothetical protein
MAGFGPHDDLSRFEAGATFEPGPAGGSPPMLMQRFSPPDDPLEVLPVGPAQTKWIAIDQRWGDAHNARVSSETMRELQLEIGKQQKRIADLTRHKGQDGYGLDVDAPQVAAEQKKLDRAITRRDQLRALSVRSEHASIVGQLRRSVADWRHPERLHAGGDRGPAGVEVAAQGRDDCRRRGAVASGHRHQERRACGGAKGTVADRVGEKRAKSVIDALAEAGQPPIGALIRTGQPLTFNKTTTRAIVANLNREAIAGIPVAFTETTDVLALFCWTFGDKLLAKINERIEELGDDKNALDQTQREVREAELGAEILDIERAECALIWAADARRKTLDFRPDTSPMAVLGVGLVTKPAGPKGTSSQHAYDVIQPGR